MNLSALERITNPEPPPAGASGERILHRDKLAETTARLMAEVQRQRRAAAISDTSPEARMALDMIAGRPV